MQQPPGTVHPTDTYSEGMCLDADSGASRSPLKMQSCSPEDSGRQTFKWVLWQPGQIINAFDKLRTTAATYSLVHVASSLCVSVMHNDPGIGVGLDLYECQHTANMAWSYNATSKTVASSLSGLCMCGCKSIL